MKIRATAIEPAQLMINNNLSVVVSANGLTPVAKMNVSSRSWIPGKSAYQVWLDQGNTGTEQDFLDSLKGGNILLLTAGETLGGGRVVKIETDGKAYLYDTSDESNYGKGVGITKAAAILGAPIEVYVSGEAYEAGSGWTPGVLYYAGASGVPTTSVPSTGIIKLIGVGSRADAILMTNIFEII